MKVTQINHKPVVPPPPTYTIEVTQVELDILEAILGNTAASSFHRFISHMYRTVKLYASRHNTSRLTVEGTAYRVVDVLKFEEDR